MCDVRTTIYGSTVVGLVLCFLIPIDVVYKLNGLPSSCRYNRSIIIGSDVSTGNITAQSLISYSLCVIMGEAV